MESEHVHMATESNEIHEKLKKKLMGSTVLDSFTKLTSDKEKIRLDAGLSLLKHLNSIETTDKKESEYNYTLDRLVRGVGSSRSSAKTGFYSVLVALLTKTSDITVENVLETIKKHLSTGGSNSKSENADICMGQILACGAMIHAGMFTNATKEEQTKIIEILITAGNKRSYLSLATYTFLTELLDKLDDEHFKTVWSSVKEEISKPWTEQNLDTVYFLLLARTKFPAIVKSKFLKKTLNVPEIVHEDSIASLCSIFMNIPQLACLKHPVYATIAKEISEKSLIKQWCLQMDSELQKPNRNKQLITTTFLISLLENLTDHSIIPDMLNNQYIKWTVHTFRHSRPKERDYEYYMKMDIFFKTLTKKLQNDEIPAKTKIAVLKKLLFYPGTFIFEKITRTKIIQQITLSLNTEGVKNLLKLYKEVVVAKKLKVINENDSENWINSDRLYAAQLMVKLLGHSAVQKELDWRLDQLKFFLQLGLFKENEESIVGVELASALKDCFYHALDQRLPKLEDLRNILSSLVHYLNENIFETSNQQLRTPLTEDGVKCWTDMLQLVTKLEGKHKFKHSYAIPVFHTLLLHMGLQLFSDFEMAQNALSELHSCFTRLETESPKKRKLVEGQIDSNEPVWIEVVIDLFLSLLSHNSHLLRSVIGCVFPYLCPHLTMTAVRQILDVLDPKNEQNPLSKNNDSDEDDDDDVDVDENESNDEDNENDEENNDISSEESDDSGLEEEDLDEENEKMTEKLRIAVRDALHKTGYQTDDESEDMDEMDEDEGKKLDKALQDAFKMVKKSKGKKNKQTKNDKTLTHFRVRVLDLIEIYLDSEPGMIQCLEIACLLLQTLEFSIRDVHQKPLEHRVRSCLKKLSSMKKFGSTEDISEDILANMLNSFLDKGSKSAFIYQDMGDIIAECCMFIIRCSQTLNNTETTPKKSKKKKSQIVEIFKNSLETFFNKRDCLLPLPLFKNALQQSWEGNWSLVPLLVDFAFKNDIRPFRRSQALELLNIFYCNNRFRTLNLDEFKIHVAPLEKELSNKTIQLLQSLSINPKESKIKEKFVCLLLTLLTSVKSASESDNIDWKTIGESVRDYRSHVTLAKDAKLAYNKLCRALGISNLVKMQLNKEINDNNDELNDSQSENNSQTSEDKHKEKKRKKVKTLKKDVQKLKKEARLLRLKASSEGLTDEFAFSNISLSDIKTDAIEENISENDEPKQKKKKTKTVHENGVSNDEVDNNHIKGKSKKHKVQQNGVLNNDINKNSKKNGKIKKRLSSESEDSPTKKKIKK